MSKVKWEIDELMKMEENPLVYLEYSPSRKKSFLFSKINHLISPYVKRADLKFCMGYVSRLYSKTYRITTCRHLIANDKGELPSKADILEGLEVFSRYKDVNKKFYSFMFEDVDIKIHSDEFADLLFIEITNPDHYNFQLLNQAASECEMRFPGEVVYYFQNHKREKYFRLYEGKLSHENVFITKISKDGKHFFFQLKKPAIKHRAFHTINTTNDVSIIGASGSPILTQKGEVAGIICAHDIEKGKGIYLSIEDIEVLYNEIVDYHE